MSGVSLNASELEKILQLARRDYYGNVIVEPGTDRDGLDYKAVTVLLTDMGEGKVLHTFKLTPKGLLSALDNPATGE